ncbi:MAG: hypothetical protein KBH94_05255 [Caldisericia bacterium]|nr:hypothetical protein [Caldisericia bacterium]
MANTISDKTWRDKYRLAALDQILRRNLIAEAICEVDRSDAKRIDCPYGSQSTAVLQELKGTYTPATFETRDDWLEVNHEVIASEHIYDFESVFSNFDLFSSRFNEQAFAVAEKIDKMVLNELTDEAGESYPTPAGGFTSENTPVIFSNLISKVAGYADAYKGLFIVLENTDIPGIIQKQINSGFSYADMALKNGFLTSYMGVDIYVTRTGTFVSDTIDEDSGLTYTNSGHRVFGVKKVATYASARGVRFEEKPVSGKTGLEVTTIAYVGFKLWEVKKNLIVDITITASAS